MGLISILTIIISVLPLKITYVFRQFSSLNLATNQIVIIVLRYSYTIKINRSILSM